MTKPVVGRQASDVGHSDLARLRAAELATARRPLRAQTRTRTYGAAVALQGVANAAACSNHLLAARSDGAFLAIRLPTDTSMAASPTNAKSFF